MATYRRTTLGCFVGIFTQAVISNLTAILFVPMMGLYGFEYRQLGILVAVNFLTQTAADFSFSRVIDRVGYRKIVLPTCLASCAGLALFAFSPLLFPLHPFSGILAATVIFSFSSGLLEILLSPIVATIPSAHKGSAMSLMHSFYAWGQVVTIVVTTLFLFVFGSERWFVIVALWMLVPLGAFLLFVRAPFPDIVPESHRQGMRHLARKPFYLIALLAILFGASSEIVINNWASTFMEKGLALPKLAGDLLGMCGFAAMLGLGRTLYGIFGSKIDISKVTTYGALLAFVCYITVALSTVTALNLAACILCGIAVSLLWPGTIILASDRFPLAGAWMFAILAAFGDIGGAVGPWLTGEVIGSLAASPAVTRFASWLQVPAEMAAIRCGLLVAAVFPLLAFFCHCALRCIKRRAQ